jgi:hypothetical protein
MVQIAYIKVDCRYLLLPSGKMNEYQFLLLPVAVTLRKGEIARESTWFLQLHALGLLE